MATIRELNVYPLKSGRGVAEARKPPGVTGFEWDRHWMAASPGRRVHEPAHPAAPRARRVRPISLDERSPSAHPTRRHSQCRWSLKVPTKIGARLERQHLRAGPGRRRGRMAHAGRRQPARLLRISPVAGSSREPRFRRDARQRRCRSQMGFPFWSAISASLEHLNSRMPEPVPMERFRPNIVIDGLEPFEEDRIAELRFRQRHSAAREALHPLRHHLRGSAYGRALHQSASRSAYLPLQQGADGRDLRRERSHRRRCRRNPARSVLNGTSSTTPDAIAYVDFLSKIARFRT